MSSRFSDEVEAALALTFDSTAWERTIDITTYGARTGLPRRIEIWFHHHDGHWYLSSIPAQRDWYANLIAHPGFVFHLKHGVRADLRATAHPVLDPDERHRIFQRIVDDFNQPHDPARVGRRQHVEDWDRGSPLLEITFDDR